MRRLYSIFYLFFFCYNSYAQVNKLNFELQSTLKEIDQNKSIQLFLRGDNALIKEFVVKNGGVVKYELKNIIGASLPASAIRLLNDESSIEYIEYSKNRVKPLNDTMLVNNVIIPVHNGDAPLLSGYTGKDVVLGFIDTGIDLTHPDFQNSDSTSRVKFIWDQNQSTTDTTNGGGPERIPEGFDYGQEWTDTDYNNGMIGHTDPLIFFGHGANVAGVGAGNGLATGDYKGAAPDADIIMVALNFFSENGLMLTADATKYIYNKADELQKPCAINCSEGDYYGSHDGLDAAALIIDSLVNAKRGRAFVCAAGNSGTIPDYHLHNNVTTDTTYTFFKYNPASSLGYGAVFYEIWADTAEFNNVNYAIGADKISPSHEFRGYIPFKNTSENINTIITDTLKNQNGNTLAIIDTWVGLRGGQYQLQVHIAQPDSNQYNYRFASFGNGSFDCWSIGSLFGTSDIIKDIESINGFTDFGNYIKPDNKQSIVSSWACSPYIITVGNYNNRKMYLNADTIGTGITINPATAGEIAQSSSRGPTRNNVPKPEIAASGDYTIAPSSLEIIEIQLSVAQYDKVAADKMHNRSGGTSASCPVVAGIAALYLEKCNSASQDEIMSALINSAYSDNFADSLPGLQWGNGKADAFATLNYFNENAITSPDSAEFCIGDNNFISVSPSFELTIWNNGDTLNTIFPDSSGSYYAEVYNLSGCKFLTDTAFVEVFPSPDIPIIEFSEMLLFISNNDAISYQWYLDGEIIEGAVDSSYLPVTSGNYNVEITNEFGCSSISGNYLFIIDDLLENEVSNLLTVFPVPASDFIEFNFKEKALQTIKIYVTDSSGRVVLNDKIVLSNSSNNYILNVKSIERGQYTIKVVGNNYNIVKKIILI